MAIFIKLVVSEIFVVFAFKAKIIVAAYLQMQKTQQHEGVLDITIPSQLLNENHLKAFPCPSIIVENE